ncbi:MAG: hypothetical protein IKU52_04775 [Clostridia bacterium]|nr:hypothetical protein [Clostridia bacterium]
MKNTYENRSAKHNAKKTPVTESNLFLTIKATVKTTMDIAKRIVFKEGEINKDIYNTVKNARSVEARGLFFKVFITKL